MERAIVLTGIGGQGIQLVGTLLSRAAVAADMHVSMLGVYGGEMRGGPSGSTIVISDERVKSPPKVSRAWSIISFHPKYWSQVAHAARPDTTVFYNQSLALTEHDGAVYKTVPVPATDIARSMGSEALGAMIMLGAFLRSTGLFSVDSIEGAMHASIPAYRHNRIAANVQGLQAGYAAVTPQGAAA